MAKVLGGTVCSNDVVIIFLLAAVKSWRRSTWGIFSDVGIQGVRKSEYTELSLVALTDYCLSLQYFD